MRLPPPSAAFSSRVRYGRYVARRARRERLTTVASDLEKVTSDLLAAGRAWEDTDGPLQDALADRDAADDDLDTAAQQARTQLSGRSVDAVRTAPYTLIFNEGITYYTAATLDQEVPRYTELKMRLAEHLPAKDAVRVAACKAIDEAIALFQTATKELSDARTEESLAATRLAVATEAWERQIEKTYGALVTELGRTRADSFFPRIGGKKSKAKDATDGSATAPANN